MSLLSKLFGKEKPTLSDVVDLLQGTGDQARQSSRSSRPGNSQPALAEEPTPIGRSWGKRMPEEPNQYNYPGTYHEYFEALFREEFRFYTFTREENPKSRHTTSYTFYEAGRKILVVELLAQGSDVYLLRERCKQEGIPYLRFYYNHEGWWNARSYVVNRMKHAIGH
ncbi:MAG: hypothetical protein IIY70_02245 [Oscillospiraceae bacterium]|nr:hypothetical protein [Oscillospiraceae bacterium]